MAQLKRISGELIAENENKSLKQLAERHKADLRRADLTGADLRRAYLIEADLTGADLRRADLIEADLSWADLSGAYLRRVDLSGTKIEFHQFPSIRLLSSMPIKKISDDLILELMRWDAYAHPHPEKFDKWAKGGECPYQNEERWWFLPEKRKIWKSGNPTMRLSELILEICRQQGWGIKGYLEMKGKSNGI